MTRVMGMAATISTSTLLCSSSASTKSASCSLSSLVSWPQAASFHLSTRLPQLGTPLFSTWSGLNHLGISVVPKSLKFDRKRRLRRSLIHASLFGVGAPEALVIGVVALLVFGPKGLAEVARNLGKTLRAFQPTIKELQEVSKEFKSTLEREIGLDEISTDNTYGSYRRNSASTPSSSTSTEGSSTVADPNGSPSTKKAYTTEDYLMITEEQLKISASGEQGQRLSQGESQSESKAQPGASAEEPTSAVQPSQKPESEV